MMDANHEMPKPLGIWHDRERGSALVLTLGILALLLITAMVFVFTANTEREAASVNADVAKAELICKAAMERSLAFIDHGFGYNSGGVLVGEEWRVFPGTSGRLFFRGEGPDIHMRYMISEVYDEEDRDVVGLGAALATSIPFSNPADAALPAAFRDLELVMAVPEPFKDLNGNGKWDPGEPFLDTDGDMRYGIGIGYYPIGNDGPANRETAGVWPPLTSNVPAPTYWPVEPSVWIGPSGEDSSQQVARDWNHNCRRDYTPASRTQRTSPTSTTGNFSSWHHILGTKTTRFNADGTPDPDPNYTYNNVIYGRLAFLVIDESGKIDLNAIMNRREPFIDFDDNNLYDNNGAVLIVDTQDNGMFDPGMDPPESFRLGGTERTDPLLWRAELNYDWTGNGGNDNDGHTRFFDLTGTEVANPRIVEELVANQTAAGPPPSFDFTAYFRREQRWGYHPTEINLLDAIPASVRANLLTPDFLGPLASAPAPNPATRERLIKFVNGLLTEMPMQSGANQLELTARWMSSWGMARKYLLGTDPHQALEFWVDGNSNGRPDRLSEFGDANGNQQYDSKATNARELWKVLYVGPTVPDMEAYWEDDNGNGRWDDGEDKHRFDLAGTTVVSGVRVPIWNQMDWSDVGRLQNPPSTFGAANTGGIQWLRPQSGTTFGIETTDDLDGNGVVNDQDHAMLVNQIVANLIDYCDYEPADAIQTTNNFIDPTTAGTMGTWLDDRPVVGLEMVPYLNEFIFTATIDQTPDVGDPSVTNYDLVLNCKVELANIYNAEVKCGQVRVIVSYRFKDPQETDPTTGTHTFVFPASTMPAGTGYVFLSAPSSIQHVLTSSAMGGAGIVEDLVVTSIDAYLLRDAVAANADMRSSNILDYSRIQTESPAAGDTTASPAVDFDYDSNNPSNTCVSAEDPRANTSDCHWHWADDFMGTTTSTEGTVNPRAIPSAPDASRLPADTETVGDPTAGISTAYIRNAHMRSLWELGAIHRGEPWRTLNLRQYNSGANAATKGTYANGDARILSQVKLGPQTETSGKVNANTAVPEVWNALLSGIRLRSNGYHDPVNGGFVLGREAGETSTQPLVGAIMTGTVPDWGAGGIPMVNRGKLADVASTWPTLLGGAATDREREELIGKLANILTVRPNYFTIITVGQSVFDVGDDYIEGVPADQRGVEYFLGERYNANNASEYLEAHGGWWSASPDPPTPRLDDFGTRRTQYGQFDIGFWPGLYDPAKPDQDVRQLDQILAEKKAIATVYRDGITGKSRILRIQYLTE